ncbi:MAG: response regulator transcription factor [Bacteroidaceae bacterium]|nr:response regulator transcription factor [Bacteroidaceae bacterium]MBP5523295.1 response regulator transcription factor [Bacteroidaceae bacterium]MBQ4380949.1 response regulator transcription factor [Bacteroidaceae bacterium]
MNPFKVIIVEDVKLELKGTEQIFRNEIPEAEIVGTAMTEEQLWPLMHNNTPDLVLLDLGLAGSTTAGIDVCKQLRRRYPNVHILIFTGEILNERLWVDALDAGADGIVLKTGELLTPDLVYSVMNGNKLVFNQPILQKIVQRFRSVILSESQRSEAMLEYDIDEYDERFLRHLALGYTKDMIANLRTMPFGVKSLEKRQADLTRRLFSEDATGVNATRLVTKALQLNIINLDNLTPDA